jgi:acetyl esterase
MSHHRNPKSMLTPAMHHVLDRMARSKGVPLHALSAEQARAVYALSADFLDRPAVRLARVEQYKVPARDGTEIPVRLYAPSPEVLPVLVYFHGGGFTIGSVETHDSLCRRLADQAQSAVISVDYRLAPEFKFPTAHNDAWDAVQWVASNGELLRIDASKIAVGGDSAGGTLAIACAIEARNLGLKLILQLLFYPGCIGHQNTESHRKFASGFVLEQAHITYFFEHYLRSAADRNDWRFAVLDGVGADGQRVDFANLAPAWLGLAECDPLVDEGIAYADILRMAGVAVDLEIYRGVVHEFIKMGRAIPEADIAIAQAAIAIRIAMAG